MEESRPGRQSTLVEPLVYVTLLILYTILNEFPHSQDNDEGKGQCFDGRQPGEKPCRCFDTVNIHHRQDHYKVKVFKTTAYKVEWVFLSNSHSYYWSHVSCQKEKNIEHGHRMCLAMNYNLAARKIQISFDCATY